MLRAYRKVGILYDRQLFQTLEADRSWLTRETKQKFPELVD